MKNQNKILTIASIVIVALTSTLVTYAKGEKETTVGAQKEIEVTLKENNKYGGCGTDFRLTSTNEEGKVTEVNAFVGRLESEKVKIPSDTVKLEVSIIAECPQYMEKDQNL